MATPPSWVSQLKPSGPVPSELLEAARARSSISVDALSRLLFTQADIDRQARILAVLEREPVFDKSRDYYNGRIDTFKLSLARAKRLRQLRVQHGWSREENIVAMELIGEVMPYNLHFSMFCMTLREQGTPEQHRLFLDRAEDYKIFGCYAQTELGHGSNVRGLETTATWNQADKTFVLRSPYLTSAKWWIGSLGMTANHAVVMAYLIIDGRKLGLHHFVVQIRDLETHLPLPGVYVGDVGPKAGQNTMDNGFLLLRDVTVPHVNMLARFARVDPDSGEYIVAADKKPSVVYATVTYSRSTVVLESGRTLARGLVTAVRYAAGRRQFNHRDAAAPNGEEVAVLEYSMVQVRLYPLLAYAFGLHFTGRHMMRLHAQANATGTVNSDALLGELHAESCALKSYVSTVTAEGIEVCRRAMGGHGFSSFSGLVNWYGDYLPTVTWEGDNHMITQQVAMFLLKCARSVRAGKPLDNVTSRMLVETIGLGERAMEKDVVLKDLTDDEGLVRIFAHRCARLTLRTLERKDKDGTAWNDLLLEFYRLSTAFSQYLILHFFHQSILPANLPSDVNSETAGVLRVLFRLLAWRLIEDEAASGFLRFGLVTLDQVDFVRDGGVTSLLKEVHPHAVRLVDAWNLPDFQLNSSLGRADGKVYEDLFYRASEANPLNAYVVDPDPNSAVLFRPEPKPVSKL